MSLEIISTFSYTSVGSFEHYVKNCFNTVCCGFESQQASQYHQILILRGISVEGVIAGAGRSSVLLLVVSIEEPSSILWTVLNVTDGEVTPVTGHILFALAVAELILCSLTFATDFLLR